MRVHELKTYPCYFQEAWDGNKTFEVRLNDRDFRAGDIVVLNEWDGIKYSGREIMGEIKYVLNDTFVGLAKGYVAFSLKIISLKSRY